MEAQKVKIEMTSNPELVSVIRLTTSGIASKAGFDFDEIEDMKVAVSEACTNAIKHSEEEQFCITYFWNDKKIEIQIKDEGTGYEVSSVKEPEIEKLNESGLGLFIIKTLMDEVDIKSVKGDGTIIKMIKYLGAED